MTDFECDKRFQNYLDRILIQATPSMNDTRFASYVRYINEFLKFFGTEKCFLVGSSAEKTKLTWSKDDGDGDFLFVSGKLSVPVSEIEIRPDNPCFVWVRGEHLDVKHSLGTELITNNEETKYIPAAVLRDVDPRLFTFLRGVFKFVSRTTDGFPSERTMHRMTATGMVSKVGLERTQFRNLKIVDKDKIPQLKKYIPKTLPTRPSKTKQRSKDKNFETLNRVLELFALFNTPGTVSEHRSNFEHFANVVRLLLGRQQEERIRSREKEPIVSFIDTDKNDDIEPTAYPREETGIENTEDDDFERFVNDLDFPSDVKATYKEKFMNDFVPALRIQGELKCLQDWYNRNGSWPSEYVKKEICNSECYVIAKSSPLLGDQRDFCLAFNHAELKLAKALTAAQRKCFLLLKAYHKGIFEKTMERLPTKLPLKTFHLKTVLYWVLEETGDTSLWWEENLIEALRNVLMYLKNALLTKNLCHYFTEANLFLNFETNVCSALVTDIDSILKDPVECLQKFFDLENEEDVEITLTDEQVKCLIEMSNDGGVEKEADIIEDVMEDFMRGFQEAAQDRNEYIPIKEAMDHVVKIVIGDEAKRKMKKASRKKNTNQTENLADAISCAVVGTLGNVVYTPSSKSHETRGNEDLRMKSENDQKKNEKSIQEERTELGLQLAQVASAFVFNPLSTDERKALEGDIKQKGFSYFLEEPPD